mgnify:CR=1 FL=1
MALLIALLGRSLKFRPGRAPAYGSRTASSPDAVQGRPQPTNSGRPLAPSPPASSRARDWLHDIREQLRKTTRLQPRQGLAQRARLIALDPRDHRGLPVGDLHQQVQRGREPSGRDPVRAQRRHDVRGHGLGGPVEHPDRAHIRLDPLGGLPRRLFIDRPPASAGPCPAGRPDRPAPAIAPTNNRFSRSTRRSCAMVIEARKTG